MFAIYSNQVNAYVILQSKTKDKKYDLLRTGKLELFSQNSLKSTKELRFACDDMSHAPNPHNVYATVWINTDGSWDDTIDLMKLTIRVEYQECNIRNYYLFWTSEKNINIYGSKIAYPLL